MEREEAVAGQFYPEESEELRQDIGLEEKKPKKVNKLSRGRTSKNRKSFNSWKWRNWYITFNEKNALLPWTSSIFYIYTNNNWRKKGKPLMETENNVTELKTNKDPQYDDILVQSAKIFGDKPVIIAMLDRNETPMFQIGKFNIKDLTYLRHILNENIDAAINRAIQISK